MKSIIEVRRDGFNTVVKFEDLISKISSHVVDAAMLDAPLEGWITMLAAVLLVKHLESKSSKHELHMRLVNSPNLSKN